MMNLNLGSCNLLLMFIVLVILPVVKFKTLIISLLSFFFDDNIPVSFIGIYAVSKPAITS